MNNTELERMSFSVAFAERRDIGDEWNHVVWNKDHHHIQYHRLYFLTKGNAKIKLRDRTLDLEPGIIYLVPAFSVLESNIEGVMNKYYVHFQCDSELFSLYGYFSDKYSVPASPITEYLFQTIVREYTNPSSSAKMKVMGAMNLLLADFVSEINATSQEIAKFAPVLEYINKKYMQRINLDDLSSIMNISTMYFSNYFKKVFRVSPKQFILNKRLIESQRLLLLSRMSIREIANAVGFENENYFSEFFSAKVGISALKFRNRELPRTRETIL